MKKLALMTLAVALAGCNKRDREAVAEAAQPDPKPVKTEKVKAEKVKAEKTEKVVKPVKAEPEQVGVREAMLTADTHGTAPDIYADYQNNSVAADRKYKDKSVTVVGVATRIGTDIKGRGTVYLIGGESPLANVICYFDKARLDEAASLNSQDTVVIVGKCRGKLLGSVILEGCRLIVGGPDPKEVDRKVLSIRDGK